VGISICNYTAAIPATRYIIQLQNYTHPRGKHY